MGFVGSRMDTTGMAYHPLLRDELVMVTPNTPHYQAAHRRGARGWIYWASDHRPRAGPGTDRTLLQYMARMGYSTGKLRIVARLRTPRPLNAWWFRAPAYRCCRLYP